MKRPGEHLNAVLAALDPKDCRVTERLADATGLSRRQTVNAVGKLIARGLAARREIGCYVLTGEGLAQRESGRRLTSGPAGPRDRAEPARRTRPNVRSRAWSAMRVLEKFTLSDLTTLAIQPGGDPHAVSANIARYVHHLARAGYLRELPRQPGAALTSNGFKRWRLVRDTGPVMPVYSTTRRAVHDRNTGEFHSTGESSHAR